MSYVQWESRDSKRKKLRDDASCQPHGDHQHEYKLNYASPVKIWSSLQQLLKLFNFGSVINRWISIFYNNDVESDSFMTSHFSVSRVVENMSNNRAFDLLNLQTQSNTIAWLIMMTWLCLAIKQSNSLKIHCLILKKIPSR